MDKILTKAVWKMRKQDDYQQGREVNVALIPTGGGSYQLYFPSKGCRYACTMCNYGFNHPVREEKILKDLEIICDNFPEDITNIILESSGSFLDEDEIPENVQEKIMKRMEKTSLPQIQIETHYTTLTQEKIQKIKRILPSKEIVVELGLESTNPEVFQIYNKEMELKELLKKIWLCEENGIEVSLNLLVGAPLLTINEQIEDVSKSIQWILSYCPKSTSIVLFPLNVKDYTLVKHMYLQGRYSIIRDWEFIEVLKQTPKKQLDRVYISWWGNRCNEFHGENAIIKPFHCNDCHKELNAFYRNFVKSKSSDEKARLIEKISTFNCRCKEEFVKEKENQLVLDFSYTERLEEEKKKLILELNL